MLNPERNDVSIEKLFKWGKQISIVDSRGKEIMSCFIRLVGDADMNKARVYGLRKSAELRKKLRDLDSDERVAYVADKELITKEELVTYTLLLQNKDITEKAYKLVRVPYPKEPTSTAGLEAQEKYQQEVDNYQMLVRTEVQKYVDAEVGKEKASLEKLSFDALYLKYESIVVNDFCEVEMLNAFRDYCVTRGSYKDENFTDHLFSSVDDFRNLPQDLKQQFENEYNTLEIDVETLKKLPEVTPSPGFGV